ncbi:MAG: (d)CMP kinase [Acidobacteria bacterium]|nr:(d)CMP kinase [Acidobacteriota bacterium]
MRPLIVAIDGPSGAGKGTVARAVAKRLGYRHIDTGAMYRAVAWKALHESVALEDEEKIAALASQVRLEVGDGVIRVDGQDVADAIRTPEIDAAATKAAVHDIASALEARDHSDRTRAASPLAQAPDAVAIDTTGMPIDEVVEQVLQRIKNWGIR